MNPNTKQYWKWLGVKITDGIYKEIKTTNVISLQEIL
jgi:hypothetical protein